MEKVTLEAIVERLDRLEKIVREVNQLRTYAFRSPTVRFEWKRGRMEERKGLA